MQQEDPEKRLEIFKTALDRGSFGQQEIVEQLSQTAITLTHDQKVKKDVLQNYIGYSEEQLLKLEADKPNDARIMVFTGTFYRAIGQLDKAAEQFAKAQELSPRKSTILEQQGFIALTRSKNDEAVEKFKTAFELDTNNLEAREYYAAGLLYVKKVDEAVALMDSDAAKQRFAKSDFLISAANEVKANAFLETLLRTRIEMTPITDKNAAQNYASLAFLYYQNGKKDAAIATLGEAGSKIPTFTKIAACISDNIKNGKNPESGCTGQPAQQKETLINNGN
jgi:tetratricopeptide (TPR) repeat protein